MHDSVGAILVVVLLWLVIRLAFGGSSQSSGQSAHGQSNARGAGATGGAGTKESAAAVAWRESRNERERQLKERKQAMLESARR
ncbi:hypothetical protein FA10DRAFT_267174 [Acaromyces ingoldii]|uniref:Uncharacterized protein n=1 Tax=Acaromyces ingoldii TaxID=215250 RepID=A0A316YNE1_9BASI|nr:hypothetical protein FA10DRAFT_267174 [Acaromyces ingoldii]PWN90731.1 hypothetical protein FA10DRAFT_267174 [Acaromyces ingoldii]